MSICKTCENEIWCPTWTQVKCAAQKKVIHGYKLLTDPAQCKFYKKRRKDFKESKCQCETCIENDLLGNEYLEE